MTLQLHRLTAVNISHTLQKKQHRELLIRCRYRGLPSMPINKMYSNVACISSSWRPTCDQAAILQGPQQASASPQPQSEVSLQRLASRNSGPPTQVLGGETLPLLPHTPARLVLAQMMPSDKKYTAMSKLQAALAQTFFKPGVSQTRRPTCTEGSSGIKLTKDDKLAGAWRPCAQVKTRAQGA